MHMSRQWIRLELNKKILLIDIDCIFRMEFRFKDLGKKNHMTLRYLLTFHGRSLKADLISEATFY